MPISRIHETISIHTNGNGTINKVKVPYLEMKRHDIASICQDINRIKAILKNTKSLDAVLSFLENNTLSFSEKGSGKNFITNRKGLKDNDRAAYAMSGIKNGMNEKTIIRNDFTEISSGFRYRVSGDNKSVGDGDRATNVMQSVAFGMNEKSVIRESRDHYATIHPTQKPVRLLERLLALVSKEGDLVLDPFSGSASTAIACINTGRRFAGFEIDKEYYEASMERLNKITKTPAQKKIFVA
jgi:site-specific DNA-methyltransferase (adenine-specific)